MGGKEVRAKIWRQQVGRVSLLLLDADIDGEPRAHRELTQGLYKGAPDLRLRQQVLLGVGGMRALEAMRMKPTVVHLNEGHAAFASVERLVGLVQKGKSLDAALETVRASTVFTTHTPVPAGHDRYGPADVAKYMKGQMKALGLTKETFADMARETPGDKLEPFCMTVLGLRTAGASTAWPSCTARSAARCGWVLTPGRRPPRRCPSATSRTVCTRVPGSRPRRTLYSKYIKPRWNAGDPGADPWSKAAKIPLEELWALRNTLRAKLVHFVRERLARRSSAAARTPARPGAPSTRARSPSASRAASPPTSVRR